MKRVRQFFRYDNIGLLYILPAFIYMMLLVGYPIVSNIVLGFQDVTVKNLARGTKHFVGLQNCIKINTL